VTEPGPLDDRLVGGRYRLRRQLGRGGMAVVWEAHDEVLGRDVAVKEVLPPRDLSPDKRDEIRERALREARAAARLAHRSVVTIYDVVEDGGRPWIVMELLPPGTLADVLETSGPLTPAAAARIGLALVDALRTAHAAGVLHRDVKPSNVMLAPDGRVVLTDFGIATVEEEPNLTATGMLVGSPGYMSPERARGERPTAASDLWSLGATLYAAVEGEPPFRREGQLATLHAVITQPAPAAAHGGALAPLIARLLDQDPLRRPGADEAHDELQRLAARLDDAPSQATTRVLTPAPTRTTPFGAVPVGYVPAAPATAPAAAPPAGSRAVAPVVIPPVAPLGRPTGVGTGKGGGGGGGAFAAVAIAVLAAAAVLAFVLLRPDGGSAATPSNTAPPTSATTKTSASTSPSRSTARSTSPSTRTSTSSATSPSSSTSSSSAPSGSDSSSGGDGGEGNGSSSGNIPSGFALQQDPTGFSVAVPQGWSRSISGTDTYYKEPNGRAVLQVAQTTAPKPDALADWQNQASGAAARFAGYRLVRLEQVAYRGWDAADWEFTWNASGGPLHVVNRNVRVSDRRAYALYWSVPSGQWSQKQRAFDVAAQTFQPAA